VCSPTGAIAVAVPLVTAHLQRSQRRDDKRADRLDELRSVVDAASVALAQAENALRDLEVAVEKESRETSEQEDIAQTDAALVAAQSIIGHVAESWHRTAVRLGWSCETCNLYGAALADLKGEFVTLADLRDGGPSSDDLDVWSEVIHGIRASYSDHRAAFYASASRLVGPA
jgi:hypothetical protein